MPLFEVTIREVVQSKVIVKARSAAQVDGMDMDDQELADACADGKHCVSVDDREVMFVRKVKTGKVDLDISENEDAE